MSEYLRGLRIYQEWLHMLSQTTSSSTQEVMNYSKQEESFIGQKVLKGMFSF